MLLNRHTVAVSLAVALCVCCGGVIAQNTVVGFAQNTIVDRVRELGPTHSSFVKQDIEEAVQMLEWQQQLMQAQINHISELKAAWEADLEKLDNELGEASVAMDQVGLSAAMEESSLAQLSQRRLESRIELEALRARQAALAGSLGTVRTDAENIAKMAAAREIKHLQEIVKLREDERAQVEQLNKGGFTAAGELRAAEAKVAEATLQLEQALNKMMAKPAEVSNIEQQIAEVSANIMSVEQVANVLEKSVQAAEPSIGKIARLRARTNFYRKMIEQCNEEVLRIQLRNGESTALLRLCKQAIGTVKQ